jgi:hypothetical protein
MKGQGQWLAGHGQWLAGRGQWLAGHIAGQKAIFMFL